MNMTALLEAVNIPEEDKVKVVKIQLLDVPHTWWQAEEERLGEAVSWKVFSESFMEKFFPWTAQADMEQQFINLKQGGMSIDEYTVEFTRFSRFALYMVAKDGNRDRRFEQGLNGEIKWYLASTTWTHMPKS